MWSRRYTQTQTALSTGKDPQKTGGLDLQTGGLDPKQGVITLHTTTAESVVFICSKMP